MASMQMIPSSKIRKNNRFLASIVDVEEEPDNPET